MTPCWARGGDDRLFAGTGDDLVHAGVGNDSLYGGRGADRLSGDFGNDLLAGNAGDDFLAGQIGEDTLFGGAGGDFLNGGGAHDILYGGDGADRFYQSARPTSHSSFAEGRDWVADYDFAEGVVLVFRSGAATDFALRSIDLEAGDASINEVVVQIEAPYGPMRDAIVLVDGAALDQVAINLGDGVMASELSLLL